MAISPLRRKDGGSPNIYPGICTIHHLKVLEKMFNLLELIKSLNHQRKIKERRGSGDINCSFKRNVWFLNKRVELRE